jgi:hypothetical protein
MILYKYVHSVWSVVLCDFNSIALCINSMDQSLLKANSWSAGQEMFHILWNPKIHFPVHKNPPLAPILSEANPVKTRISCLFRTHLLTYD